MSPSSGTEDSVRFRVLRVLRVPLIRSSGGASSSMRGRRSPARRDSSPGRSSRWALLRPRASGKITGPARGSWPPAGRRRGGHDEAAPLHHRDRRRDRLPGDRALPAPAVVRHGEPGRRRADAAPLPAHLSAAGLSAQPGPRDLSPPGARRGARSSSARPCRSSRPRRSCWPPSSRSRPGPSRRPPSRRWPPSGSSPGRSAMPSPRIAPRPGIPELTPADPRAT
jgi:hypothetical protein